MKKLLVLGSLALVGLPVAAEAAATCGGQPVTITASAGPVQGTDGDDVIDATAAQATVINAGAGNDIICLGDGLANLVIGGDGVDTISYEHTTTIMVAELDGREGIVDAGAVTRIPRSLTRIPDPLPGGLPPASEIKGGVDVLLDIEIFIGSPQDDIIIGRLIESDIIHGGAGDDIIIGLFGDDVLHGGPGNDLIFGDGIDEVVYDPIREQQIGPFTKPSFATDDDVLYGGDGHDGLNDETGKNEFYGGAGNDAISGGWNDDIIDGGPGVDVVSFTGRPVTLDLNITAPQNTGHGMDTVRNIEDVLGSEFDDFIIGTFGPNIIRGQGGNDTLYGRPFPSVSTVWDTIDGGAGDDTCFGVRNYNCETIL
jgi:Ca2+-binding RTX toxin-like protein